MNRLAHTGLTALALLAALGLASCAVEPAPVSQTEAVRYAEPTPVVTSQPVLAALPPPRLSMTETPAAADLSGPNILKTSKRVSCVPFARVRSGINLSGDAKAWWKNADGKYLRSHRPEAGNVMVFAGSRRLRSGHVAVVRSVVSNREIRIDHANWMSDGRIYVNVSVIDVSPNNDWSKVRVWNGLGGGQIGTRVYPVSGFIAARNTASLRTNAVD
jgi:surface antigen